jgi:cyclophilin family peptidyl-prolyl cis-trans isomerase/HEAT repeat protein
LLLLVVPLLCGAAPPAPAVSRLGKMARILALEDRRTLGDGELERYLSDPDRSVRRRAVLAAGRIGDAAAVPRLIELMNDGEVEVRQMSAFGLGLVGSAMAVERLQASLKDTEAIVRARSAEALGRIGDARAAADVARMVLEGLPKDAPLVTVRGDDPGSAGDPWIELRLGLFALARLKDVKAAESVLLAQGKPRFDWWAATWTAMRLESPALKPVLVAAAGSSDPLSRAFAARGLGALKDASAVDLLAPLARDKEQTVAVNALRALAVVGDARGVPLAAGALAADDLVIRVEALKALAGLPSDRSLRAKVVSYVGHREGWVRAAALQALARTDRDDFALVLSGMDADPDWSVRAALAAALADAGDEVSVGILLAMLKDEDVRVLPAVLEALRKARGSDAVDTLVRHLEHPDFAVRAAAADNLATLKAMGLSAPLASAYKKSLSDADLDARLAQVAALAVQKDDLARATLREAAKSDPSRVVRERAGAALKALGEDAPPPGPEAVVRPLLDYRLAMAPYDPAAAGAPLYTPRAFVHTRRGAFEIHLNVVEAPLAVRSFIDLAQRGFFDGLTFHRVVPGFVIQGGDPRGDGNGGPGYTLRCEIGQKPYGRGVVGMALSGKDTGGSQFFVSHVPTPQLDGGYAVIGWVASGMDVVDQIRAGDVIERIEIWN